MGKLTIALFASVFISGCATTKDWSIIEPYEPVKYNTPLVNGVVDSTVSIVRTQAEGFIAVKTLTGIIGVLY